MSRPIDIDKRTKILELRAKGKTFRAIAEEVGVAKQSVVDECKRNDEKIATLKAFELEELYERHRITKEERIAAHASLMARIREEIDNRDLTEVPTEKLIDLYLKQGTALEEQIIEPKFLSTEEQDRNRQERELLDSLS